MYSILNVLGNVFLVLLLSTRQVTDSILIYSPLTQTLTDQSLPDFAPVHITNILLGDTRGMCRQPLDVWLGMDFHSSRGCEPVHLFGGDPYCPDQPLLIPSGEQKD